MGVAVSVRRAPCCSTAPPDAEPWPRNTPDYSEQEVFSNSNGNTPLVMQNQNY